MTWLRVAIGGAIGLVVRNFLGIAGVAGLVIGILFGAAICIWVAAEQDAKSWKPKPRGGE